MNFMKTKEQKYAFENPLIGAEDNCNLTRWNIPPWRFALSFNR